MQHKAIPKPNHCPRNTSRSITLRALLSQVIRCSCSFSAIVRIRSALPGKTSSYPLYIEGGGKGPENEAASNMEIRTFSGSLSRTSRGGKADATLSCLLACCGSLGCLDFVIQTPNGLIHIISYRIKIQSLHIFRITWRIKLNCPNFAQRTQSQPHPTIKPARKNTQTPSPPQQPTMILLIRRYFPIHATPVIDNLSRTIREQKRPPEKRSDASSNVQTQLNVSSTE